MDTKTVRTRLEATWDNDGDRAKLVQLLGGDAESRAAQKKAEREFERRVDERNWPEAERSAQEPGLDDIDGPEPGF